MNLLMSNDRSRVVKASRLRLRLQALIFGALIVLVAALIS
jgi:hypothetical protein